MAPEVAPGGRRNFEYRFDGPDWTNRALLAVAAALCALRALLWAARRPWTVALGLVLVPLALGAGTVAFT